MTDRAIARIIVRHLLRKILMMLVPTRGKVLFVVLILLGVFSYTRVQAPTRVYAAVSDELNFQARLYDPSGNVVDDGAYTVEFRFYNAVSGGSSIWDETHGSLVVKNGYFSVQLGSVAAFPGTIDWSQEKWMTMNVESDGEMTPRIKLTATPYSLRSGQADTLTNGTSTLTADQLAQLAPAAPQAVNSALAALRINQTGAGLLAQLQGDGSTVFTISKTGQITTTLNCSGNVNGGAITANASGELECSDDDSVLGGNTTLQTAYDNDTNGGDTVIGLTNNDDSLVIRNPALLGTDSGYLLGLEQLSDGAVDGLRISNAGTGALALLDNTNAGGNGVSIDVQSGASGQYVLRATSNNGATTGLFVRADGLVGIGTGTPTETLDVSGGIRLGNSVNTNAGTLRWSGVDFEGYDGTQWVSLTSGGGGGAIAGINSFYAYDAAGGIDITAGWTDITLDTEVKEDSDYTHATDSAEVTINTDGWYEITYSIGTINTSGNTRSGSEAKLQEDTGGGYTDIPGSLGAMYNRQASEGENSTSSTVLRQFTAGDKIKLQARMYSGGSVATLANSTNVTIKRFTDAGGGGGSSTSFEQNGNSFGATAVLGTTDNFGLNFITNNTSQLTLDASGNLDIINGALSTNGTTRLTNGGVLQNITGLTITSGGASVAGGIDNNSGGITEVGALSGVTTLTASGAVTAASFTGDGSGLTSLSADNISSGTLSDVRLSSNVALLDTSQTYTALDIFSAGLRLGTTANTTSGNIRWTGSDFEGYDGSAWISFTESGVSGLEFIDGGNAFGATATLGTTDNNGLNFITNNANRLTIDSSGSVNVVTGDLSTAGSTRLTNSGALQNITGLTIISGGANITGGIDNNSGGITEAGAVAGVTTLDASGAITAGGLSSFTAGLTLGNTTDTTAGNLRWSGVDFEGYNGTEWVSLTSGGGLSGSGNVYSVVKPTNETVNNSATFQDDDHLFFPIGANEKWTLRYVVQANSGTVPDLKFTITAPSGATCSIGYIDAEAAVTTGNLGCGVSSGVVDGNGASDTYEIVASIINGANAGTVQLQWAQNTATASNTTVFAGSYLNAIPETPVVGGGGSGTAFEQNGNAFGATAILGTTDTNGLNIITNNATQLSIDTSGNVDFANGDLSTAGTTRLTNSGALQNITGLTIISGGANITGGIDNNSGGITETGSITGVGSNITATAGLTIASSGAGSLTLDAASGLIILDTNTLQRSGAGTTTLELNDTSDTTFTITNTDGTAVADLIVEGDIAATSLAGEGSGITSLNAANIGSGTLSDVRLSSNVALLNTVQTFTAAKTFNNVLTVTGGGLVITGGIDNNSGGITEIGTVSGVSGLTFISGALNLANGGITNTGSIAGATTIDANGRITTTGGVTTTGAATNINANSNFATNINTGSSTGTITIGGGSSQLIIDSVGFDVSASGVTEIRTNSATALTVRNAAGSLSFFTVNSTGNIVNVGSSTTDATAILLVTDSFSSAADPTGVNGAIYYNTSRNRLRCFEEGIWKDCIGTRQVRSFIDTTADSAAANNTTNYWDTAAENNNTHPNITPSTAARSVTGSFVVEVSSSTAQDRSVVFRIERGIGSAPTCGSGTVVGTRGSTFTTNSGEIASSTVIFLDNPATTSQVFYTLCSDAATSSGAGMTIDRIRFTLEEANNSN